VWAHAFEYACAQLDIEHRTTKPKHPRTNGQVERMNRTIKDATVKHYHYDDHDQFERHLADFVSAYNFGRRLKTDRDGPPADAWGARVAGHRPGCERTGCASSTGDRIAFRCVVRRILWK